MHAEEDFVKGNIPSDKQILELTGLSRLLQLFLLPFSYFKIKIVIILTIFDQCEN